MARSIWKAKNADIVGIGMGLGMQNWTDAVQARPAPEKVARLQASHGFSACCERWGFIPPATLAKMVTQGKRLLRDQA